MISTVKVVGDERCGAAQVVVEPQQEGGGGRRWEAEPVSQQAR